MKKNLYKYLAGNEYPGRGIVLGQSPDGSKVFVAYWIMGRSANSRNRVFEPIEGGIRTVAADPAKLEDPHLIIYNAVLTLRETTVVTNGDQTDTIAQFMNGNLFPGYSFEAALATRTYEDDAPNFTPRISGVVDMRRGGYKLSIVKSNEGNADSVQRQTYDYPQPVAGEGHFISTYVKNGAPIPSFAGEPLRVAIDTNDADKFAEKLWGSLNEGLGIGLRNIHKRVQHTFGKEYGLHIRCEDGCTQIIIHLPDTRPEKPETPQADSSTPRGTGEKKGEHRVQTVIGR